MSGFNLTDLNLSDVEVQSGGGFLKPGRYVVKTSEAKLVPLGSNDGSMKVEVKLTEVNGAGSYKAGLNVYNRKSTTNTEIARKQLKAMLTFGGHHNPDHPGAISSYNGLTVGVVIKESGSYVDKNGVTRTGSDVSAFIDPAEIDPATYTPRVIASRPTGAAPAAFTDGIPFAVALAIGFGMSVIPALQSAGIA